MARYDRIAPLASPSRDNAFPGWWVLRDIDGLDRDAELARRARLRFLALRPVLRLLGASAVDVARDSYIAQIEAVREELGYLPSRDAERARLARFLHQIEDADPNHVAAAALEMAEGYLAAGQLYAAEEYANTALAISPRCAGNITLSAIARARAQWKQAIEHAESAVSIDPIRANAEIAMSLVAQGDVDGGRRKLRGSSDPVSAARLAALELGVGDAASALEHGVPALRTLDDLRERVRLLEIVGLAFARLGLYKPAERCFAMVAQRGVDPGMRARARALQAVTAALSGNLDVFRERRSALLNDTTEWNADPRIAASVQLELGRASVIARDVDFARDHLRAALAVARKHNMEDILGRAEEVLSALEQNAAEQLVSSSFKGPAADNAKKIAEQFEALPDLPVVAT